MDKYNILLIDKIKNLEENEIDSFISSRVSVLENKENKTVGLNTDNSIYSGFLDNKIKVNVTCEYIPVEGFIDTSFGSVVFDDNNIFKYLIKEVKDNDNLYTAVIKATKKYLFLDHMDRRFNHLEKLRSNMYHEYSATMNKSLSIETFHKNKSALCLEVSGVVQNMFKFLGIDSDYVIISELNKVVAKDSKLELHAFNVVYPEGRDNEAILFDVSNLTDKRPLVSILSEEQKNDLLSNKKIVVTNEQINNSYRMVLDEEINWKRKTEEYLSLRDGYPETIIKNNNPFTIQRKLIFKREKE